MVINNGMFTVASRNGAHVNTESIGEIHESPSATPFKLLLISPSFCAYGTFIYFLGV